MADLLDPEPANAAGAIHGQLASALPEEGLAVSCHKLVDYGARTVAASHTRPSRSSIEL